VQKAEKDIKEGMLEKIKEGAEKFFNDYGV
jgi:hypothetical protein